MQNESMFVTLISPYGYCSGVQRAMELAFEAASSYEGKDIYLLGLLVHNESSIARLQEKGIRVLDERDAPLLDQLMGLKKGDIVIFSAHGHPDAYDDIAQMKGLVTIDATCPFVSSNRRYAEQSKSSILYIGVEGHLESEAFLANVPDAFFYDVKKGANLIPLVAKDVEIVTQTTLGKDELDAAMAEILSILPKAKLSKARCYATSSRQEAIAKLEEGIGCVIVLGSPLSNNSKKLYELALKHCDAYLVRDLDELKTLDLTKYSKVALCSGASTSRDDVLAAKAYLESL